MSEQPPLLDVDPHVRRALDFYRTPAWMTLALLARLPPLFGPHGRPWRICEPCVGDGAIVDELSPDCDVVTNDVVVRPPMLPDFLLDARLASSWAHFQAARRIDVVLSNPTFEDMLEIAQHALPTACYGMALLGRVTWLEPTDDRDEWLMRNPPTRAIVLPRWNFRGVGSDSATCAWFLWANHPAFCAPGIDVVTKAERDLWIGQDRMKRFGPCRQT